MSRSDMEASPRDRFQQLLLSLFSKPEQLRRIVGSRRELRLMLRDINFQSSTGSVIGDVIDWMERHGADETLFNALEDDFEGRRADIEQVRLAWFGNGDCAVGQELGLPESPYSLAGRFEMLECGIPELLAFISYMTKIHEIHANEGTSVTFNVHVTAHLHDRAD